MTILQLENKDEIKRLLEAERRLGGFIGELEPHKAEMPAGAFQHLTTAENLLQNKRSRLEKDGER